MHFPVAAIGRMGAVAGLLVTAQAGSGELTPPNLAPETVPNLERMCNPGRLQAAFFSEAKPVMVRNVPNGPELDGGARFFPATEALPAYCQVTGSFVTNSDTGKLANFFATLPANWNGKYIQFGCAGNCGGFGGSDAAAIMHAKPMQGTPFETLRKGYASYATDGGHLGSDPDWASLGPGKANQDAIDDWAYRASQKLAGWAKAATVRFYSHAMGRPQTLSRSYFNGCSGGGRDAFVAASYFPEEFDGIIGAVPYADPAGHALHTFGLGYGQMRSPEAYVPNYLVRQIDGIVKAQCDAKDGVKDDLIQNPAACDFRPERDLPICNSKTARTQCFTAEQAKSISVAMSAVTDEAGRVIYPGFAVSEFQRFKVGTRPRDISAVEPYGLERPPSPFSIGDPILRQIAFYDRPEFRPRKLFSYQNGPGAISSYHAVVSAADAAQAAQRVGKANGANPRNAEKLIKLNRKFLIWQDMSDEVLTPYAPVNYYKQLAKLFGGYGKLQRNVRLFAIPGSSHCASPGPGPNRFETLSVLEDWVERGKAPEMLVASLFDPDPPDSPIEPDLDTLDPKTPPIRTMPLCKFPIMARYRGTGDINEARNWSCPANDQRMLEVGESGRLAGVLE